MTSSLPTSSLPVALAAALPLALLVLQATLNVPQLVRVVRARYGGVAVTGEALTVTTGVGWLAWSLLEGDPAMAASAVLSLLGFGPTTWMLLRAGAPWRPTAIVVGVVAAACGAGLALGGSAWLAASLTAMALVQYGAYVQAALRCDDWSGFSRAGAAMRVTFGLGWAIHGAIVGHLVLVVWGAMTVATFSLTAMIALRSSTRPGVVGAAASVVADRHPDAQPREGGRGSDETGPDQLTVDDPVHDRAVPQPVDGGA